MSHPTLAQLQHRRTHNLLLVNKLFNQRDNASPFTLILDSLEQSGRPVVREFVRRAKTAKTRVVFVAFESLRPPTGVEVFIPAASILATQPVNLVRELTTKISTPKSGSNTRTLVVIDGLNPLASATHPSLPPLPTLLTTLIATAPNTSLLSTLHADIPIPSQSPYAPHPLTLLSHLATTLITPHSATHVIAAQVAASRSLAAPVYGLAEERDGVIAGLGRNGYGSLGKGRQGDGKVVVLEVEHRRKSGRGLREWYVLGPALSTSGSIAATSKSAAKGNDMGLILLEDWLPYREASGGGLEGDDDSWGKGTEEGDAMEETTFSLGLTEKQRRDREGVVLPYFDAQKEGGVGEGGRILYQMGEEDDFDEEEDEI